ncbi:MAG: Chorismate pyruvate-lyase [Pseudomonadota bacterium]|jgi:chorismate--pyruvate lyase
MAWRAILLHHETSPALRAWATHVGSLTAKLRERYPDLRVKVLRQTRARPHVDECAALGIAPTDFAWIRDVVLLSGNTPLVVAHSVLPPQNLVGAWSLFSALGARPLGEVLFTDPAITRGPLYFSAITARHPFAAMAQAACPASALPHTLWARRSLFQRGGKGLLVSEIFLPSLL